MTLPQYLVSAIDAGLSRRDAMLMEMGTVYTMLKMRQKGGKDG